MKRPDEIKKGLECAVYKKCIGKECPYFNEEYSCISTAQVDALAYIQQFEAENAELKRERDALLAIVKGYGDCEFCKHGCPPEKEEYFYDFCIDCDIENCRCRGCTTKNNHWEWRGPCEENGGPDA